MALPGCSHCRDGCQRELQVRVVVCFLVLSYALPRTHYRATETLKLASELGEFTLLREMFVQCPNGAGPFTAFVNMLTFDCNFTNILTICYKTNMQNNSDKQVSRDF